MDRLNFWRDYGRWRAVLFLFAVLTVLLPDFALAATPSVDDPQSGITPQGPAGLIREVPLAVEDTFSREVSVLLDTYETDSGVRLVPGPRGKVGIKVNTRSGRGLSTPLNLLRAVIEAFEARGFERSSILIVDYSAYELREADILPPLSKGGFAFEGCPVYALDRELYYDEDWYYDSPQPPARAREFRLSDEYRRESTALAEGTRDRKSFLPVPLLFEVDFWVNLAVVTDDAALGIDGALASATLWNVSNHERFLASDTTASVAVAEIAGIPELSERLLLHFVSLARYQYIGGPKFNSLYTHSEPLLWMSSDPVAIDRLLFDRMNELRRNNGFPEIPPFPRQLPFAASLGLGVFEKSQIEVRRIPLPEVREVADERARQVLNSELPSAERGKEVPGSIRATNESVKAPEEITEKISERRYGINEMRRHVRERDQDSVAGSGEGDSETRQ